MSLRLSSRSPSARMVWTLVAESIGCRPSIGRCAQTSRPRMGLEERGERTHDRNPQEAITCFKPAMKRASRMVTRPSGKARQQC